ncbi:interleukin-2 receptor subunit alpha-like isoform X1 [Saccopteryx leptura]|uniref:interleukin-2 receptor subunit alpha-like isoform X1 n=1 Tax=Saccopteryx leptura TaxID=249018 RepID=UPI00339CBC5D
METSLLIWRFFTFIMITDCVTDFCDPGPPNIKYATFKALTYKMGTLLTCDCKKHFRRISSGSLFMNCTGNSGHSSWRNQCQCVRTSSRNTEKQATPKPKEQKERETTEMPSHMQPTDQINLLGHCKEPPPWEHEASKRKYYFVVGQTVYYECAPGFRALQRGPAESICKMKCGKTMWTKPLLKCTNESSNHQFPGDEESQTSSDAPWGSETSCSLITTGTTTDFQNHADVTITTKMFTFTIEYQIAVAGCILLLVSVLLLSVLTWQWRWSEKWHPEECDRQISPKFQQVHQPETEKSILGVSGSSTHRN